MEKGNLHVANLPTSEFRIPASSLRPIVGYQTTEGFPYCCGFHKGIFERALDHYQRFPDCCDAHRKLAKTGWFHKSEYTYLPAKAVTAVAYTQYAVRFYLDRINWYKEITDYMHSPIRLTTTGRGGLTSGFLMRYCRALFVRGGNRSMLFNRYTGLIGGLSGRSLFKKVTDRIPAFTLL